MALVSCPQFFAMDDRLQPRIDGVFIGPYDLSLSHGFPTPSPDPHPEVEKMIQNILALAHAEGKKWSVHSPQVLIRIARG